MSFTVREPSGSALTVQVNGAYHPHALGPFRPRQVVDGYHFDVQGHPALHAIQAAFIHVNVTDPHGAPVHFTPWFGALAHAIFFQAGSLHYFHTHVCAAGALNCSSLLGGARVTGHATAPGKLTLGSCSRSAAPGGSSCSCASTVTF